MDTLIEMSPSVGAIAASLAAAKLEFGGVRKDRKGQVGRQQYMYTTLGEMIRATEDALSKRGLVVVQSTAAVDGIEHCTTILAHESGEWIRTHGRAPVEPPQLNQSGNKVLSDVQEAGKTGTYLQRYAYSALLGLAPEEDDDGSAIRAAGRVDPAQEERRVHRAPKPDPDPIDEKGHRASFAADRARFCAGLKDLGTTYEEVAEMCESLGRPRPSAMAQGQRDGLRAWLDTDAGKEKLETYQHEVAERAAIQGRGSDRTVHAEVRRRP